MIYFAIALIVILIGLYFVFFFKKDSSKKDIAKVETKKDESKTDSPKKIAKRDIPLEDLLIPGNFPEEIVFYFGSQTGTAEKLCNILQEEAQKVGIINAKVMDFEDFKPEVFSQHELAIICVATHYEGDPCDNTKKFFKWVRENVKTKETSLVKGMKFSIFGLGDTSYEQYNYISKYFNEHLEAFGGERIYKYGEGNAEGNKTEDDFNEWKADLWMELFKYYEDKQSPMQRTLSLQRGTSKKSEGSSLIPQLPLLVRYIGNDEAKSKEVNNVNYDMTSKQFVNAFDIPVESIVELRQNCDEGSTLEVTYDLTNSGLNYITASNLAIFPKNTQQDVEVCAKLLGLPLDQKFIFEQNPNSQKKGGIKHPFPTPITIKEALEYFVDLTGPIRKKTIKDLSSYCMEPEEQKRLLQFSDSKEDFQNEIESKQVGLLQLLQQFTSLSLSPEAFFQIAQRIMPRYYTIASSNLKDSNKVKIAISLTIDQLSNGNFKYGATSKYLKDIYESVKDFKTNKVTNKVFIHDSLFKQPAEDKAPMIMVGPGTGVVPFIGFMEDREVRLQNDQSLNLGPAYLFFGCRNRCLDFIYKDKLEEFQQKKLIENIFYAFSRESVNKVYVQDQMKQQKELVIKSLLEQRGYFYICGNTKMGQEMLFILKEFIGEEEYKVLEKEKRIIKELWG